MNEEAMKVQGRKEPVVGGLAGWLLQRLQRGPRSSPRLVLLERITLAPRQSLALVEADGRKLLVATSPEGAPAFYVLDGGRLSEVSTARRSVAKRSSADDGRISW